MTNTPTTDLSAEELELLYYLQEEEEDLLQTETILPRTLHDELPLSFAQQRLWFLSQLDTESAAYNMSWAFRLTGSLHVDALRASLQEIVQRHEVLRTNFQTERNEPVQVIVPVSELPLPVIDLTNLPDSEAEIRRLANAEATRPFSLENDLMLRVKLLRLSSDTHVLLLTLHHIAFDGWSIEVFWRELQVLYATTVAGQPSPLSPLAIQYADFALWQRGWLQADRLAEQLTYWKEQLSDLAVLQMPTDHPRPPVQSFRGGVQAFTLPKALCEEVATLSRQAEVTLFMSFLATFNVLLARYTAQDDIVVGSPIANRNRAEIEDLIGFFVNTLVLRTDLSGNPTFYELLARVREMTLGAYQHQDIPFEKLVEELAPARDMSRNPLVQVLFAVQNAPQSPYALQGITVTVPQDIDAVTVRFDLEFHLWPTQEGFTGHIYYNTDLFDAGTIERMAGHFQTLLQGIVANPGLPIADLPLLTDAERRQLLVAWNDTTTAPYRAECVHQLFEAQVERTPDATALLFGEAQLTYRELNRRANQMAHHLIGLGVGPDVLVAISVERSLGMVVGVLAILKAGGGYVPLDPEYPKDRLALMLEDVQAPLLLTQQQFTARFPKYQGQLLYLDAEQGTMLEPKLVVTEEMQENPYTKADAANLGYVVYTSGSTGKPKGIAMPHRALLNLIQWELRVSTVAAAKTLQYSSLNFDASFTDIFMTLGAGGALVIIPETIKRDPLLLARFVADNAIEKINLPVVVLQQLAEAAGQEQLHFALKEVLSTAEQLQVTPAIRALFAQLDGATLHNQYGPAETHVVTAFRLTGDADSWPALPPIGQPIDNTQIYILDQNQKPVPIGIPGMLYIGGDGLARGYLNQPERTDKRFVPNPFDAGSRLYNTGDQARYLSDGNIEYLGRKDNQVKIRGFRIELGEVESTLAQHPKVQNQVVIVRQGTVSKELIAYYVPQGPLSSQELRHFLQSRMPDYMIPAAFVSLDVLPLTPNGKVDRRALPAPSLTKTDYTLPRTFTEELLSRIWAEVLGLEVYNYGISEIDIHQNFFEAGGHSLSAVHLMRQIYANFQVHLPLANLFEFPTIAGLAGCLDKRAEVATGQSQSQSLQPIRSGGKRVPFFFVPGGEGNEGTFMLYAKWLHLLGPEPPIYGFYARGLDGYQAPHRSVPEMAADYVAELRTMQPEGPYFLGGECIGGKVAFEMGRQLRAQGEEVALLLLMDTEFYPPTRFEQQVEYRVLSLVKEILPRHFAALSPLSTKERMAYVASKLSLILSKREQMRVRFTPKSEDDRRLANQLKAQKHYLNLLMRYQATAPYPGQLTLVYSGERQPSMAIKGWQSLAQDGIELFTVPGSHRDYLGVNVQTTAAQVRNCLEAAYQP